MAAKNANKTSYANLKKLSGSSKYGKRKFSYAMNQHKSSFSKAGARPNTESNAASNYKKMMENMQKNYDSKLNNMEKGFAADRKKTKFEGDKKLEDVSSKLQDSNDNLADFQKRINGYLTGQQAQKQKEAEAAQAQAQQQEAEAAGSGTGEEGSEQQDPFMPVNKYNEPEAKEEEVVEEENTDERSYSVDEGISYDKMMTAAANVKIGYKQPIGEYSVRFTNLFAERTGENAVSNRTGHAAGIDIVVKGGGVSNVPLVLADGVIINVSRDGNGDAINTAQGSRGGYIIDVRMNNDPSKVVRYLHLSPDVMDIKDELIGKNVSRGDTFVEDTTWSGSGTAPHMKIKVTSVNEDGSFVGDYTSEDNNPTKLVLFGTLGAKS